MVDIEQFDEVTKLTNAQGDIVQRLRQANDMQEGRGSGLFSEAADEIERLRQEVESLADIARDKAERD